MVNSDENIKLDRFTNTRGNKKASAELDDLEKAIAELEGKKCSMSVGILKGLRDEKCKAFNELIKKEYNAI